MCLGGQESQWHPSLYQKECSHLDKGGDYPSVLSTGEAAPCVLCSVLGPSLQEITASLEAFKARLDVALGSLV